MGFFQSLKEDLATSVNELIGDVTDGYDEDSLPEGDSGETSEELGEMRFSDGEPLLSDGVEETTYEELDLNKDYSNGGNYEDEVNDLLGELKNISEEENSTFSVKEALDSLKDESVKRNNKKSKKADKADDAANTEGKKKSSSSNKGRKKVKEDTVEEKEENIDVNVTEEIVSQEANDTDSMTIDDETMLLLKNLEDIGEVEELEEINENDEINEIDLSDLKLDEIDIENLDLEKLGLDAESVDLLDSVIESNDIEVNVVDNSNTEEKIEENTEEIATEKDAVEEVVEEKIEEAIVKETVEEVTEEAIVKEMVDEVTDEAVAEEANGEVADETMVEEVVESESEKNAADDISDLLKEYQDKISSSNEKKADMQVESAVEEISEAKTNEDIDSKDIKEEKTVNESSLEDVTETQSVMEMSNDTDNSDGDIDLGKIDDVDDADLVWDRSDISSDTAIITPGMVIDGSVTSDGNMELRGKITGNVKIKGKLSATGKIFGDTIANEVFLDGAEIRGAISAKESVKIANESVVIGDISANAAAIAGAVKGDIDVKGPVILDSTAIIMGNIKSMSVQINNGAVIEGMCSQCYAKVNPSSFFEEISNND